MQVTETTSEGLKRAFKVVIPAADIDGAYLSKLQEIGRKVRLPGFRPGKVPITILKQRYGQSVIGEVLEETVDKTSRQTMSERGLRPAVEPKIAIQSFDHGKDLEYTIELEALPEIEIPDLSAISIERPFVETTEEMIEESLQVLTTNHPHFAEPAEARPAQSGDQVVIDCAATVDGQPVEAMSRHGMIVVLGTEAFVSEVEQALVGRSLEDHLSVTAEAPEHLAPSELAGKSVQFEIDLNEIREPVPRVVDDEFAAIFGLETADDLRSRIRQEHEHQFKQMARARAKRLLLDRLAEQCHFDLPESLVSTEFEAIWHQIEHAKEHGHLSDSDAAKSEDVLKSEYREIAERRVRLGLLLSEVSRRNGIEVSRDELSSAIVRETMRYAGAQYQQILNQIKDNPAAIERFRAPLLEEKAVDFILELADVQETPMSKEALTQLLQDEEDMEAGAATDQPAPADVDTASAGVNDDAADASATDDAANDSGSPEITRSG